MVGHIRYANDVHDALLRAGLNGSELHAALVCYRAARGWGGLESEQVPWPMSAGLVVQATTLKRSVAARALAGLRSKGIIIEHEPRNGPRPALFLFVECPDSWTVGLVSTQRDIHAAGHRRPRSGTVLSTQRDSGVHGAGQSIDENHVQQRNVAQPKTEDREDNKTESARAREEASDGGAEGVGGAHGSRPPLDRSRFRLIAGIEPEDPDFENWSTLPHEVQGKTRKVVAIFEVDGDRIVEVDGEFDGCRTLREAVNPKREDAPAPPPPPKAPEPLLTRVSAALREAVDSTGGDMRAEADLARALRVLPAIVDRAEADGRGEQLLSLIRKAEGKTSPAAYVAGCFWADGTPKTSRKRAPKPVGRAYVR